MKTQTNTGILDKIGFTTIPLDWEVFYHEDSDALYWTVIPAPKEDKLIGLSPEVSFYVHSTGVVRGLMIEWFKNDFLAQNPGVASIVKFLTKEEDGYWTIPEGKKEKAQDLLVALFEIIQKDVYKYAMEAKVSVGDLEQMLSTAFKSNQNLIPAD